MKVDIDDKTRIILVAETQEDAMNIGKLSNEIGHSILIKDSGNHVSMDFDIEELFSLRQIRLNG